MNNVSLKMIMNAQNALANAYAPYSKFSVAACICTKEDRLFTGVNVENCSYGLTVCAETSAICQMVASGATFIKSMVILAGNNALCSPCGACRQRIQEFSTSETLIHLCDAHTVLKTVTINDLLPMAFSLNGF